MIFFCLVRVACQTVSVFYFPTREVATCSPRLPIFFIVKSLSALSMRFGFLWQTFKLTFSLFKSVLQKIWEGNYSWVHLDFFKRYEKATTAEFTWISFSCVHVAATQTNRSPVCLLFFFLLFEKLWVLRNALRWTTCTSRALQIIDWNICRVTYRCDHS